MKFTKIKNIEIKQNRCYDITVENNHNFFCNGALIHNCDYTGELKVILMNHGEEIFRIKRGDRIAQIVFVPVTRAQFEVVGDLESTSRGSGGFGSTGD